MKTLVLNGEEILRLGFSQGKVIGLIIRLVAENYTEEQKEYVLNFLKGIMRHPQRFREHRIFGEVAYILLGETRKRGQRAPVEEVTSGRPSVAVNEYPDLL